VFLIVAVRSVNLTDEQIEFIRTSLDYSARSVREYDYGSDPEMRQFGMKRRQEAADMIASIREALRKAVG
jgi:hypothetical protein